MRIIAGEFRGRRLLPPNGPATRPITDRVKQSVFDVLAPNIADATVLDCFAGTGSLGLEALSRGASHAVFYESDRSAAAILRRNIHALGVSDRSRVITSDLFAFPTQSSARPSSPQAVLGSTKLAAGSPQSLVFLDPPYRYVTQRPDDLRRLVLTLPLLVEALVIFRHAAEDALDLPPLKPFDRRVYGGMVVDFLIYFGGVDRR
jgi:16S rRNA (guanine966-N2)-methyltransferase